MNGKSHSCFLRQKPLSGLLWFGYDRTGSRTTYFNGSATITYVSRFYEVQGATTTKHLYAGDTLVASVETVGATTSTYTVHTDHLGRTNVVFPWE